MSAIATKPVTRVAPSSQTSRATNAVNADAHKRLRLVVNNTLISFAGQGITWASTLILTTAYGRFLGATGFGKLYLATTLVGLIGFPLEFGFNQQIVRDVARTPERAHRYLSSAIALKFALWLLLWGALLLTAFALRYSPQERLLVSISGATLLMSSIGAAFSSMHIAVHRNVFSVTGGVIEKVFDAALAFVLLRFVHVDVVAVACVLLVGATFNMLWQGLSFIQIERPTLRFERALAREIIVTSIPFLLYGVLGVIYYRIDTVLLGALEGEAVVGAYGAGYKLFDTLVFLPGIVMSTVMYPLMARLSKTEPRAYRIAVEKSTNFLLLCGVPIATTLAFAAPQIVGFLYHRDDFLTTIYVIQALAPGVVLLYLNSVIANVLITTNRERRLTWMAGAALVLNLSLNLLLIPRFQAVAAAAVTSVTELALLVLGVYAAPRDKLPWGSLPTLLKTLIASAAIAIVAVLLRQAPLVVILAAAAITYAAVGAAIKLLPREDIQTLVSALRQKGARREQSAVDLDDDGEPSLELAAVAPPMDGRVRPTTTLGSAYRAPRDFGASGIAWLQAPQSAATRARLVTRARSTSTPLTRSQRIPTRLTLPPTAVPSRPLRAVSSRPLSGTAASANATRPSPRRKSGAPRKSARKTGAVA